MEAGVTVRPATEADLPALTRIYAWHVLNGTGTFEEVPPDEAEMAARLAKVRAYALPYVVAEVDGEVAGFAYAGPFRERSAYRYCAEDSVYIAPGREGAGLGRAALSAVIEGCRRASIRELVAVIGDSENLASIGLHRALGFAPAGVFRSVGLKFGRHLDVVFMQLRLGPALT